MIALTRTVGRTAVADAVVWTTLADAVGPATSEAVLAAVPTPIGERR